MKRRALLGLAPFLGAAAEARAEPCLRDDWLGTWRGAIVFRRSLPLEDAYQPPKTAKVETDDKTPIRFEMTFTSNHGQTTVRTRIEGGPMQTGADGETMVFVRPANGVAPLADAASRASIHAASLTTGTDSIGTETLFRHADGSFWRRHVHLRFVEGKADVIVWVFDAEGTRARTWRGEAIRQP
jgi:hypothetical protein